MNEQGQKIFKWIVWIGIFLCSISSIVYMIYSTNHKDDTLFISEKDWVGFLVEGFGREDLFLEFDPSMEDATGKYIAITSIDTIGVERLQALSQKTLKNENEKIELALEYGIISDQQIKKKISEKEAEEIILSILNIYVSPEYYPEYYKFDTNVDAINADGWNIEPVEKKENTFTATIESKVPEVGELIIFRNEYGIAQAKYVDSITLNGEDEYTVNTKDIGDITEIFDTISFSGTSDFSYLAGAHDHEKNESKLDSTNNFFVDPFITTVHAAEKEQDLLAEWEWFENKTALKKDKNSENSNKCDIEFNGEIVKNKKNGKECQELITYILIKSNGVEKKYQYKIDSNGKEEVYVTESFDNSLSVEVSGIASPGNKDEKNSKGESGQNKKGIKFKAKLSGFSVCTSGYYQWADPTDEKNFVEVMASADKVYLESAFAGSHENKQKIGSFPIPVAATSGIVSIDLNFYIVYSLSGEVSLAYEIGKPYVGLNVSTREGFTPIHGHLSDDFDLNAKIDLSGGIVGEAAIMLLDQKKIADPSVDVRAHASVSTLNVKEPYELKEEYSGLNLPCLELKAQAPVIKLNAAAGKDSIIYEILNQLNVKISYDLIKKDSDNKFLKKYIYHVEIQKDGKNSLFQLEEGKTHEDVCTHIQEKLSKQLGVDGITDKVKDDIDRNIQDAEDAAKKKLEKEIEKFIIESCGGC